jgi:hypothetical protein
MSLLTSLFARTRRKNQQTIAARTAAVIDHVIYDVGIDALVNGTLLLDKRMRPRFIGSRSVAGTDVIAAVAVRELAEAEVFRTLGYAIALDRSTLNVHTGCLVFAVMREFKAQSPVFRSLP